MPVLGMAQDSGVLIAWLKQPGDQVAQGEPLMEIETDKVTVEIEAPASGILANVIAQPGESIPTGQIMAVILGPGESAPVTPTRSEPSPVVPAPAPAASPSNVPPLPGSAAGGPGPVVTPIAARAAAAYQVDLAQVPASGERITKADVLAYVSRQQPAPIPGNGSLVPASPKARRLAAERALDIRLIPGSGPDRAVLASDVQAFVPAPAHAVTPTTGGIVAARPAPLSPAWRIMAQRLAESWTTVPHFYLARDVDAGALITWREAALARSAEKITYTDLLIKATGAALRQNPHANAAWHDGTILLNEDVNIGLAVAVDDGLLVPVIHNADRRGLNEIAASRRDLVARAHEGRLKPADIMGGTFTISNLGMFGVDAFNAIVNPPQAGILAVGRITDRVVAVNGQPAVRPMMAITLSFDHRVVDGARGARFLDTLVAFIEEPISMLA